MDDEIQTKSVIPLKSWWYEKYDFILSLKIASKIFSAWVTKWKRDWPPPSKMFPSKNYLILGLFSVHLYFLYAIFIVIRAGIDKLLHIMRWSRPEVWFAVRELSWCMSLFGNDHIKAMHRAIECCINTIDRG